ncbi:hypothetical protein GZ77_26175 [Endozoicomonas montiporae]|uniref:Uncharacterized protein n=1 Tax=Endozoicomonas montiporae TaxID=1027273 RepID=A0A081MYH6_9GAMM|nr:hypothetical protein [Endozoicomonas montiporae]KEQ11249.1 hypothetical protein GZ77_26500 [Endozoicomonas montiporae]KEQ11299.1 hypothetical protein GZ77_26175 [Endozoicomonas montiporae]
MSFNILPEGVLAMCNPSKECCGKCQKKQALDQVKEAVSRYSYPGQSEPTSDDVQVMAKYIKTVWSRIGELEEGLKLALEDLPDEGLVMGDHKKALLNSIKYLKFVESGLASEGQAGGSALTVH